MGNGTDPPGARGGGLETRWTSLLRRLGARGDGVRGLFERVACAYSAPERRHHGLRHVEEVLDALGSYAGPVRDPGALEAAAWFHDIVYDAAAPDNEERSAETAARELRALGVGEETIRAVRGLVTATKPGPGPDPTGDAAVLVDADMAVLGADEARYDEYARAIRAEYAFLPAREYARRRAAFLEALFGRDRVFHTSGFRERLEAGARANVAREIERLVSEEHGGA